METDLVFKDTVSELEKKMKLSLNEKLVLNTRLVRMQ